MSILSSLFSAVGDSIGVIVAQREAIESAEKRKNDDSSNIKKSFTKENDKAVK